MGGEECRARLGNEYIQQVRVQKPLHFILLYCTMGIPSANRFERNDSLVSVCVDDGVCMFGLDPFLFIVIMI